MKTLLLVCGLLASVSAVSADKEKTDKKDRSAWGIDDLLNHLEDCGVKVKGRFKFKNVERYNLDLSINRGNLEVWVCPDAKIADNILANQKDIPDLSDRHGMAWGKFLFLATDADDVRKLKRALGKP